jgi:hypothetical protein
MLVVTQAAIALSAMGDCRESDEQMGRNLHPELYWLLFSEW